jgi:hypothetical protein
MMEFLGLGYEAFAERFEEQEAIWDMIAADTDGDEIAIETKESDSGATESDQATDTEVSNSMSTTIAEIKIIVNGRGRQARRDCPGCEGEIVVPLIGIDSDAEALLDLTARNVLCGICAHEVKHDMSGLNLGPDDWLSGYNPARDMVVA